MLDREPLGPPKFVQAETFFSFKKSILITHFLVHIGHLFYWKNINSYRYLGEVNLVTEQKVTGSLKEKNGKVLTVTECNKYDKIFICLHTCKEVTVREYLEL